MVDQGRFTVWCRWFVLASAVCCPSALKLNAAEPIRLSISRAETQVVITPDTPGRFQLQTAKTPPTDWANVGELSSAGSFTIPIAASPAFFRVQAATGPASEPLALQAIPEGDLPYYSDATRPLDSGQIFDGQGILVVKVDGVEQPVDHPAAQAQYVLQTLLSNYRLTSNPNLLLRARAHLDRILANRLEHEGAWFFPYRFNIDLHGLTRLRRTAPWYSALPQGQVLSALVRYFKLTSQESYKAAADRVFASFLTPFVDAATPGFTMMDDAGFVWFEEFPGTEPDRTWNSHIYAVLGLAEYYVLTQNPEALRLAQEGAATILRYHPDIRNPGDVSDYCVQHSFKYRGSYHFSHVEGLLNLYSYTADSRFAAMADQLFLDYPNPARLDALTVVFTPGTHSLYRFAPDGLSILETNAFTTTVNVLNSALFIEKRPQFEGRVIRLEEGPNQGLFAEESYPKVYAKGFLAQRLVYHPPRTAELRRGTHEIFGFTSNGTVRTNSTFSTRIPLNVSIAEHTFINGRAHFLVSSPPYDGLWLVATTNVVVK